MIAPSLRPLHHGCNRKAPMPDIAQIFNNNAGFSHAKNPPDGDRNLLNPPETEPTVHHWTPEVADGVPMGSIIARKRKDGSTGYRAQIILKSGGKIISREAKPSDRRPAATAWMARRENELAKGTRPQDDPPLRD